MLTQKELKRILHYDTFTGVFVWRVSPRRNVPVGSEAGSLKPSGYIDIGISNKIYRAHILAWLYVHGYFPENEIDHKNLIRHHNWIDNLREATRQCNARNSKLRATNKTGIKGVSWCKQTNMWRTQIDSGNGNRSVGRYIDFAEAVCHRLAAEQCIDWLGCDLHSSSYQYVKVLQQEGGIHEY